MEYLKIENFKCFYDIKIPLNDITFFAGANGNGKSTAIQALLYLRRTIEHCALWDSKNKTYQLNHLNGLNVELNGSYCLALGNSSYVLPKNTESSVLSIGLYKGDQKTHIGYNASENELWLNPSQLDNTNPYSELFIQEFYYLNAERIGPRISQNIKFFDYPTAGYQGEFVAQLIADTSKNYRYEIDELRRNIGNKSPRLEQQVNAWLNELMPGVSIAASFDPDTQAAQVRVDNYFTRGNSTIATNIGFGISYVLPIIVTGLIAKKGSFMIVENPEAHLHPSAQSKIGRFLAMVANAGVKVIVETHSDHVINGLQISAASGEIDFNKISINFFSQPKKVDSEENAAANDKDQPILKPISINSKGELDQWPKGFFDQSQIDFAKLFKIRKG